MSKMKGPLAKLIDRKFDGSYVLAANEMVVLFCEKYHIPGSAGYDLYTAMQEAWRGEVEAEEERVKKELEYNKNFNRQF